MRPVSTQVAACGGRTAPAGASFPGHAGHAAVHVVHARQQLCPAHAIRFWGQRLEGAVRPEQGALHADATGGDDRRAEGGGGGEDTRIADLVLARRREQPGEATEQGERVQDDLRSPAPRGAAELEPDAFFIEHLELVLGEGGRVT